MKKILALVLAAVLLLGLTPGALAEDSDLLDYSAWLELWKAENPERVKELLKDDPPLYADYGYATREEMLADWDISQAEYDEMVVYERAWDIYDRDYYEKELENWIGDAREKLGGTRSGLGVMLNGAYITFPDAQPELENGRTMIPLRTLMEAMGAQVSYLDDGTVTCLLNGTTLSFRVGESTVTVERDGKTTSVAMDCASYVKNSRTYVPVRFFAEAVGCDVMWDDVFQTAVVLDQNALIGELDKSFTYLNKALTRAKLIGGFQTVMDVSAVITAFSTLDGDTTSNVRGRITVCSDGKSQSVTAVLDVYGLLAVAGKVLDTDLAARLTPEEIAALRNVTFDMIVDDDAGVSYLKCPLLLEILGAGDVNAWVKSDVEGSARELTGLTLSPLDISGTVGARLYDSVMAEYADGDYSVFAWESVGEYARRAASLLGDGAFSPSAGGYTTAFDRKDYELLTYGQLPEDDLYDYKELSITLTVSDTGSANVSFVSRETGGDTRYSGSLSTTQSGMNLNMEVHVDNTMKLQLSVSVSTQPYAGDVPSAPPAGSAVITADELNA